MFRTIKKHQNTTAIMAKTIYRWKNCTEYSGWASLTIIFFSMILPLLFIFVGFIRSSNAVFMASNIVFQTTIMLALIQIMMKYSFGMYVMIAVSVFSVSADLWIISRSNSNGLLDFVFNLMYIIKDNNIIFFLLFLIKNDAGLNGYQVLNIAKTNGQYLKDLIEEEETNECNLKDGTISKTLDNEIRIDKEYYPYSGKILFSNQRGYIRVHEGEAVAYCILHDNGKSAIIQYAERKAIYYEGTDTHCYMAKEAFLKEYPNIIALKQECLAEFKDIITFNTDDNTEQ